MGCPDLKVLLRDQKGSEPCFAYRKSSVSACGMFVAKGEATVRRKLGVMGRPPPASLVLNSELLGGFELSSEQVTGHCPSQWLSSGFQGPH